MSSDASERELIVGKHPIPPEQVGEATVAMDADDPVWNAPDDAPASEFEGIITREHAIAAATNALRNQGYAIAVHGSRIKDLDLIAVPWRDTALTAQDAAEIVASAIPGFIEKGSPDAMPHGRLSFTIRPNWHYGFDHWYIDLAVFPRECDWKVPDA